MSFRKLVYPLILIYAFSLLFFGCSPTPENDSLTESFPKNPSTAPGADNLFPWQTYTYASYVKAPVSTTENFSSLTGTLLTRRDSYSYTPISKIFRSEKDQFIYYLLPEGSDGQTGIVMGRLSQGELVHAIWEVRDPDQPGKVFYGLCQEYESFHFPETVEAFQQQAPQDDFHTGRFVPSGFAFHLEEVSSSFTESAVLDPVFPEWRDYTYDRYIKSAGWLAEEFATHFGFGLSPILPEDGNPLTSVPPEASIMYATVDQAIYALCYETGHFQKAPSGQYEGIVNGALRAGDAVHVLARITSNEDPDLSLYSVCTYLAPPYFPETIEATLAAGWVVSEDADTAPYLVFPSYVRFLEVS